MCNEGSLVIRLKKNHNLCLYKVVVDHKDNKKGPHKKDFSVHFGLI